jgi:uncharacterized protein YbjQ (UPF0145 family)
MTQRDLRQRMLAAQKASTEKHAKAETEGTSPLSGLSTNETLFLAGSGWEPVEICSGAAVFGMRRDTVNTWGSTQDERASKAMASAMAAAVQRLEARCRELSAHGVIGTEIITEIEPRYVAINLIGTGIRPVQTSSESDRSFTSNLSPREFVLLGEAGWKPVGLASGCRFVRAYRRKPTQTVAQKVQNVELANPTKAFARARSETMVLLEQRARDFGGQGVIQLSFMSGPVAFATHVFSFVAWGTAVTPTTKSPAYPAPRTAVALNDVETAVDPASLVGKSDERASN